MKAVKKKTHKRYDTHTEHYLVPAALFLNNIAAVHVVYAYFNATNEQAGVLLLLTLALVALGSAVWIKNRILLWSSLVYYAVLLIYCWV